jgi:hypothetical protein
VSKSHPIAQVGKQFGISQKLQESMCLAGQGYVFEEGELLFEKLLGISVNARQIQRVSEYYGGKAEEQTIKELELGELQTKPEQSASRTYMMVDGSMLYTREEQWKEMKLGRLFNEDTRIDSSNTRTELMQSQYICHFGSHEVFTAKMELYADHYTQKVVIADGAKWIWKWISDTYPGAIQILDYYHAVEKICAFAQFQYPQDTERHSWVDKQKELLWADGVATIIERLKLVTPRNDLAAKSLSDLIRYYDTNQNRMKYGTYRAMGLLVGSGAIESAHRNVLQQRLKLSGQRWSINGAQNIANLRAYNKGNQWMNVVDLIKKAA